jgi:hypothetical protein
MEKRTRQEEKAMQALWKIEKESSKIKFSTSIG